MEIRRMTIDDLRGVVRIADVLCVGGLVQRLKLDAVFANSPCLVLFFACGLGLLQAEAESSASPLSDREQDVLKLLVKGLNAKQIAARLGISKNAVDTHRRRIMDKAGCNSMVERTRYAIREGYLDLS